MEGRWIALGFVSEDAKRRWLVKARSTGLLTVEGDGLFAVQTHGGPDDASEFIQDHVEHENTLERA